MMKIQILDEDEIEPALSKIIKKAKKGKPNDNDIILLTPEQMGAIFSPKRIELLHYLARNPQESVSTIAKNLDRDWKSVIRDLQYLEGFNLVELSKKGRNRIAEIASNESVVAFA